MTTDTEYKRCSPSVLDLLYNSVVNNCYMSELQLSNLYKRQRTKQYVLQSNETLQPQLKRQKFNYLIIGSQLLTF